MIGRHSLAILMLGVAVFGLILADTGIWLPFIVIGGLLFAGGTAYASFARKSWDWSVADAVITKVGKLNLGTYHHVGTTRWDTTLNVHVEYAYMVGDEQWKHEHLARWRSTGRRELREAEEFRQNNPVGKRFQLLYNPTNPFDALVNGPRNPAIGAATGVLGLALVVFGLINWLFDPALIVQIALVAAGLVAGARTFSSTDYPFERPWWFEKSEEQAEQFMQEAVAVNPPGRAHEPRMRRG